MLYKAKLSLWQVGGRGRQLKTRGLMGLCKRLVLGIDTRFGGQVPQVKVDSRRCYYIVCLLRNLSLQGHYKSFIDPSPLIPHLLCWVPGQCDPFSTDDAKWQVGWLNFRGNFIKQKTPNLSSYTAYGELHQKYLLLSTTSP